MADNIPAILTEALEKKSDENLDKMSLDGLLALLHAERLKSIRDQTAKELRELQGRQKEVRDLHDVLKGINKATSEKGEFDLKGNESLLEHFKRAKELGVDVKLDKTKYSREERDRLVENLKMTLEDLNTQNDMQIQTVQRLTNERYETYQMVRTILKPTHDDKLNKARKAG